MITLMQSYITIFNFSKVIQHNTVYIKYNHDEMAKITYDQKFNEKALETEGYKENYWAINRKLFSLRK